MCAYGRIGASPDGGMTYFLPRVVGPDRALRAAAQRPDAARPSEALEMGIVSEVVAPDELLGERAGEGRGSWRRRRPTTCGWRSCSSARASTTRSPTTCSSSATGSPTRWRPRTCARASPRSSRGARRPLPGAEAAGLDSSGSQAKGIRPMRKLALLAPRSSPSRPSAWPPAAETTTRRAPSAERPRAPTASGGGGGGGGTVESRGRPQRRLAFDPDRRSRRRRAATRSSSTTRPRSGTTSVIEDSGGNEVGCTDVITGTTTTLNADLKAGTYTYFCTRRRPPRRPAWRARSPSSSGRRSWDQPRRRSTAPGRRTRPRRRASRRPRPRARTW